MSYAKSQFLNLFEGDVYEAQTLEATIVNAILSPSSVPAEVARVLWEGSTSDPDHEAYWNWAYEQAFDMLDGVTHS